MSKKAEPDKDKNAGVTPATKASSADVHESLPADFEKKARQRFDKVKNPDATFEQYLAGEEAEFLRQKALEENPALKYQPAVGTMTPCGNGDFEKELNPAEWEGAYGALNGGGGTPGNIAFGSFTTGILSGSITAQSSNKYDFSQQAHQSWVGAGTDPYVGIPTTTPGSAGAVRIGNAVTGGGCELLSKTLVVTPALSTISFWYAAILQNPDPNTHAKGTQPYFMVRVTDAAGNVVPGAFDFGSGTGNILVADSANPFFQSATDPVSGEPVVYKDWSCAQIDLSSHVGKQVTIEFVTADCWHTGHWAYAYVDNFCGSCQGSPTGNITYNGQTSTHCGPGRICFDYELPAIKDKNGKLITGSVVIKLDIYQNGAQLAQLATPMLTTGSSYCFDITPASITGINPALGGLDFVATGTFAIGMSGLGQIKVGSAPEGVTPGQNNDYQIVCKKTCAEIEHDQNVDLKRHCTAKINLLPRTSCDIPDNGPQDKGDCRCDCAAITLPDIKPCISVAWGDSQCDCIETDDVEVLCITVCNCYSNVTFTDLSIGRIQITDTAGNPVPILPDGTPSVRVIPSGPICFGDIGPCRGQNKPACVSRELVIYTRGAVGKDYRLSFEGVCFAVTHHLQAEQCFLVRLCQD